MPGPCDLLPLGKTGWAAVYGLTPDPFTMGAVAILALLANIGVASMLYRFRGGDANMRSLWLCSRNDALVNVAIILAAAGVLGSGTRWPDLIVAATVCGLALTSAYTVVRQARSEIAMAKWDSKHDRPDRIAILPFEQEPVKAAEDTTQAS